MKAYKINWLLILLLPVGISFADESRLPVIDMHFHALPANHQGPPPVAICSPMRGFPVSGPGESYAETWLAMLKAPPCDDAEWSPASDEALMSSSLAVLEKNNVIGVASGPGEMVRAYYEAAPDRIIQGLLLGGPNVGEQKSIDSLRELHEEGHLQIIGELTTQYAGISPDDERLEPLWALAVELNLPVGIHIGTGPPGVIYLGATAYRARLHSPLTIEEVLVRHPTLRVYVSHAGWPMMDDMLAILYAHPQAYAEVAVIDWALPTKEFHRYLQRLVEAGFGKRILYGSDQMVWPGMIEKSIDAIESAPFLSAEQKRDILYNNAARFLELSEDEIVRHHEM